MGGFIATGSLKGAAIGAVTAAAFYGVGSFFKYAKSLQGSASWGKGQLWFGKIVAHGTVGGASSVAQGGSFQDGFRSAGFTQFASPVIGTMPGDAIGRTAAAAVVGGTASRLGGGKFANGAATGAFSRLFNDELHREQRESYKNPRAAKGYLGDGNFKYRPVLTVNPVELSGTGKILRWVSKLVDVLDITFEQGTRYYQQGAEYDVVLEERLVQRNDQGFITYESGVTNRVYTGQTKFNAPADSPVFRETDIRVCVGSGLFCSN